MASRVQKDFRWRYQPRNEQDVQLLEYIQNYPECSTTEMIVAALRAYWFPFAIANNRETDTATKQRVASEYVSILMARASTICAVVGLKPPMPVDVWPGVAAPRLWNQLVSSSHEESNDTNDEADYDDAGLSGW